MLKKQLECDIKGKKMEWRMEWLLKKILSYRKWNNYWLILHSYQLNIKNVTKCVYLYDL